LKKNVLLSLILIAVFLPAEVYAQKQLTRTDKVTKSQANKFYKECLNQSYPAKNTESKEIFCGCSAARFFKELRQGDIMDLELPDTWQARLVKEKILDYVYTPCLQASIQDILDEECQRSTYLEKYPNISKKAYCACQSIRMDLVFKQNFGAIAEENKENIDDSISDPISTFIKSPLFLLKSNEVTGVCFKTSEIKIDKGKPLQVIAPAPLIEGKKIEQEQHDHDHNH
jgi:hypothetical protein